MGGRHAELINDFAMIMAANTRAGQKTLIGLRFPGSAPSEQAPARLARVNDRHQRRVRLSYAHNRRLTGSVTESMADLETTAMGKRHFKHKTPTTACASHKEKNVSCLNCFSKANMALGREVGNHRGRHSSMRDAQQMPKVREYISQEKLWPLNYAKGCCLLIKDQEDNVAFSLGTFPPNPFEPSCAPRPRSKCLFSTVRHRTVTPQKARCSEAPQAECIYALFKLASRNVCRLKGRNQLPKVIEGIKFNDGGRKCQHHGNQRRLMMRRSTQTNHSSVYPIYKTLCRGPGPPQRLAFG